MNYLVRFSLIAFFCFTTANKAYAGAVEDYETALTAYHIGDYDKAFGYFRKSADRGDTDSQYNLGIMYDNGEGVLENDKEAVKWFKKATAQGHANAQYNLGIMYANGEGVLEDDKEAVKWFKKATEQGHANAEYNLGIMYANGDGVLKNYTEAYARFFISDYLGNTDAKIDIKRIEKRLDTKAINKGQQRASELLKLIEVQQ